MRCNGFYTGAKPIILCLIIFLTCLSCSPTVHYRDSPNSDHGEFIAFVRAGNVYRMNPDGSGVRLIAKNGEWPICSFTEAGLIFLRLADNPRARDFFWTDSLGLSDRRLTRGLAPEYPALGIAFSHGIVAFVKVTPKKNVDPRQSIQSTSEIYTVRIDDGVMAKSTPAFDELKIFQWSPDGTRLGFAARKFGKWTYHLLEYASGTIKQIATTDHSYPSLSWSPDGRAVALLQPAAVEIVEVDSGVTHRLPRENGVLHDVRWSPDGQYLALIRDDEQCHVFSGNIYVIRLNDNSETNVTKRLLGCQDYSSPRWSADSSKIMFLAYRSRSDMEINPFYRNIRDNIYIVNRDGSGRTNLSANEDVEDERPMWCKEPERS